MKTKKIVSVFISTFVSVLMIFVSSYSFSLSGLENKSADEVFDKQEVEKEIRKAETATVYPNPYSIQRSSYGSYPSQKGIILVTDDPLKGLIETGHAAIIYTSGTVVESLSNGVVIGKNNWNSTKSQAYGVVVKSKTASENAGAANYCYSMRGKPYNYNFLNIDTRSSFYCSQLIYAAYKDKYNLNLNTASFGVAIHPMELVNTPETLLIYRKK